MTCDERRDLMLLYAAGSMEPDEAAELRAHLATGCVSCAAALAEATAVLGQLGGSVEPMQPGDAVRGRLMQRIAADDAAAADAPAPVSKPSTSKQAGGRMAIGPAIFAALAAAIIAGVGTWSMIWPTVQQQRRDLADVTGRLAQREQTISHMQSQLDATVDQVRLLRSPAVHMIALRGTDAQPAARARIFWDTARKQWHMYAADMKTLAPGRTYELWCITKTNKKAPMGTFTINASGEGAVTSPINDALDEVAAAAITDEPAGGVEQPTGTIQVVGKME